MSHNHIHRRSARGPHRVKRQVAITRTVTSIPAGAEATGKVIGFKIVGPVVEDPEPEPTPTPTANPRPKAVLEDEVVEEEEEAPKTTAAPKTTKQTSATPSETTTSALPTETTTSAAPKATSSSKADDEENSTTTDALTASSTRDLDLTSLAPTSTLDSTASVSSSSISDSTATVEAASSGGLSAGATGGLVAGAVAIILLLAIGAFFLLRKKSREKEAYGKTEDEKSGSLTGGAAPIVQDRNTPSPVTPTISEKAPRVSVRPGSQFKPNLDGNYQASGNVAAAALLGGTAVAGAAAVITRKEVPTRRPAPGPPQTIGTPLIVSQSPTPSSYTDDSVTSPTSPTGSSAIAQSQVHRVQLDFVPSMGDELGLSAGQLVRVLHEYDDGWALCVRLDRSQQGVCPRTCLSQRPVKPRPHGPPSHRGPVPVNGHRSPPQSPNAQNFPRPNGNGQFSPVLQSPTTKTYPGQQLYRPAGPSGAQPRSPTTPTITVSPSHSFATSPQSPTNPTITVSPSPFSTPPQSPTTPTITVSPSPFSTPPQSPRQQVARSPPRPAVVPVHPSPLSETSSRDESSKPADASGFVFHAM